MSKIISDKEEQVIIQQEESVSRASSSSSRHSSHSVPAQDDHPLVQENPSIVVQEEFEQDAMFVDDRALLDDQGRPNISRTSTPSVLPTFDSDTSHTKVREKNSFFVVMCFITKPTT